MCGISLVFDPRPQARPAQALACMHGQLRHRGPDGEGHLRVDVTGDARAVRATRCVFPAEWDVPGVLASFRWLQVQDREAAAGQPMVSHDRRAWLLFNGEIYNHAQLRAELQAAGTVFETRSDSEVLLAAWRRWGRDCLTRLRGMFALAIVDLDRRVLFVARDRLGIKPLYYALDEGRFLLASEARAIALAMRGGPRAEPFRVHEYLRGLPPQSADLSFFRGVLPVPAGSWLELPLDAEVAATATFRSYWNLADHAAEPLPESRFAEQREQFEALLRDSAREHAHAAVDIGTLLSGGLDSSTLARLLAASAAAEGRAPPKAYSVVYEDPRMSEWPFQQLVIGQGGLQGVKYLMTPDQAWSTSAEVVAAQGQPLLGQDIIAQYHVYGLARAHGSVVVWDGQGSDEMFGGMPLYEAQWILDLLRRGRWLRAAQELRLRRARYGWGVAQTLSTYVGDPLRRHWDEFSGRPHPAWLARDVDSSAFGPGRTADHGPESGLFSRFLYRHVRHTNLPQVLMLQDHSSMAHGVESRVPFLDHRLVEFVFRLPEHFKLHRGLRKRILLETVRGLLPEAVVERRDKRVFVSLTRWMQLRSTRAAELRAMAASEELRDFAMIDTAAMRRFVEDYLVGRHDDERAVWRLHSLWQWLCRFRPAL